MTYEEKMLALDALGRPAGAKLRIVDRAESWVCEVIRVEIKDGRHLEILSAWGSTPADAIEACWERAVSAKMLVVNSTSPSRETFRWNGFMWERVREENEE